MVRVVIVSYEGRDLTLRAIKSVKASDWPRDRTEIVVVDNASRDGSIEAVEQEHPDVRVIQAGQNLGFAGATNLALQDLAGVDYIALLNNDATAGRHWLRPLVAALEDDPSSGAAAPKILFDSSYAEIGLDTVTSPRRRGDWRSLGVRLTSVRVSGEDYWHEAQFPSGWYHLEYGRNLSTRFRWSNSHATLRVPTGPGGAGVELRFDADRVKHLTIRSGTHQTDLEVGPNVVLVEIPLSGELVDVVNNAGSVLLRGGYGADRGILEADRGQYDEAAGVFAWCGCSALLRRDYLQDAGLFEPSFFLYYEDLDLAWRGQARGWSYRYVPTSTVRHRHTSATIEGSPLFDHFVERNRLIVHARNAPASYAFNVFGTFLWEFVRIARRDLVLPTLQLRRPRVIFLGRRLRSLGSFFWQLPPALRARRRLRRRQCRPDADILRWLDVH